MRRGMFPTVKSVAVVGAVKSPMRRGVAMVRKTKVSPASYPPPTSFSYITFFSAPQETLQRAASTRKKTSLSESVKLMVCGNKLYKRVKSD
ncbi:MAG: hypothetical protein Q6367_013655 [Candidatus Freyarchaeota archaeon]